MAEENHKSTGFRNFARTYVAGQLDKCFIILKKKKKAAGLAPVLCDGMSQKPAEDEVSST